MSIGHVNGRKNMTEEKNKVVNLEISESMIRNLIHVVRGKQVMLDSDLARLYQVETKVFNQAVKRNLDRFPDEFYFQLTNEEYNSLRSQIVTSKGKGASIKDAGKKCFGVNRIEDEKIVRDILNRLK